MQEKLGRKESLRLATNFVRRIRRLDATTCFAVPFGKDTLRIYHESLTHEMSIIAWVKGEKGYSTISWYAYFKTPAQLLEAIEVPLEEEKVVVHNFDNIKRICEKAVKGETTTW